MMSISIAKYYLLSTKKFHKMRVVSYVLGHDEDYSPEDSISYSSERLLQAGEGRGGQYICDFDEGRRHEIKNILLFAEVCCQLPEADITIKDFCFLLEG